MGNTIGGGSGRAAATVLGVVGGALLGNNIEGSGTQVQNMQQCTTQTFYENRTTGYNVVYEYGGKEFTVQMPYDPGPTIRLQVSPVASNIPQPAENRSGAAPGTAVGVIVGTPNVQPVYNTAYTAVQPAYYPGYYSGYYPAYSPRPIFYGPPLGVSLNLGYSYHRHRGHRH